MIRSSLELVETSEIRSLLDTDSLSGYLLPSESDSEREGIAGLAGKVAAKRAFFKAAALPGDFTFLEILSTPSGRPLLHIRDDSVRRALESSEISLSISHTKTVAVALCLVADRDTLTAEPTDADAKQTKTGNT